MFGWEKDLVAQARIGLTAAGMKIATFNINNINRRLPNLLDWLKSAKPDIVCLQELKCTDAGVSGRGDQTGRLSCRMARPADVERRRHPLARLGADRDPDGASRRSEG